MNEKPQTIRLFVFKILHDKQHSCRIKCSVDGFSSFFAILMLCAGLFLSVRINFFQFTHLGCAIKTALGLGQRRAAENVRRKQKSDASGVTPFQALSSALGGSIGTANIAGVASAIAIGGAGAVFYMWLAALVGMGVKFCEIVLALRYREKRGGQWCGGAMLYIEKGFRKSNTGSRFLQSVSKPLAVGFALFGLLASSVGTPLVQSNTIAMSVNDAVLLFLPKAEQKTVCIIAGAVTAALVGIVILGGIQRIGKASEIIVPFMAIGYIAICIIVLSRFGGRILPAFCDIFSGALGIKQAVGGAAGFGAARALRIGMARGVYSNEAGVGSAPMAHACANTNDPVKQGMYGIFEVFADTIVMCTMTALVVLASGIPLQAGGEISGTSIALRAFSTVLPERTTGIFLAVSMLLFAYTSLLGWAVYGMQCAKYLFGKRAQLPFCILYTVLTFAGALMKVDFVWTAGETLNYLMAAPNMLALLVLNREVRRETAFA